MKPSASLSNCSEAQSSAFRKVAVLGATGSIGLNTLDIVRQFPAREGFNPELLRKLTDNIERV
jgi:hypothetical protein